MFTYFLRFFSDFVSHAETVPTYWCYGKLEIQFDADAPYRTDWFQIEDAGDLEGDFEIITQDIALALEGITGTTRPSTLLQAGIWKPEETVVSIGAVADDLTLNIRAGRIGVIYRVASTSIPGGDAAQFISQAIVGDIASTIDQRSAVIDSIFSLRTDKEPVTSLPDLNMHTISGSQYLDAVKRSA